MALTTHNDGIIGGAATGAVRPSDTDGGWWRGRTIDVGLGAPYLLALGTVVVIWGLPLARDQLFLWLGLGMAAFSVRSGRTLARLVLEWLPVFGLLVVL